MAAPGESPTTPAGARQPPRERSAIVLAIGGQTDRADLSALCERARTLIEDCAAEVIVFDVGALVDPDAGTVDALAQLQLTARRLGRRICLRHAHIDLQELLALMGLSDVVPCDELPLEPRWQAEEREPARGIEEEADPGDPIA